MILPLRSHKTGVSTYEYNLMFSVISETLEEFFKFKSLYCFWKHSSKSYFHQKYRIVIEEAAQILLLQSEVWLKGA